MKSINILGAGPAGLTAGINLAQEGYNVTVFEKQKTCGARFHADLQAFENWTTDIDVLKDPKNMNIKVNFHCEPLKKLFIYDHLSNRTIIKSKKPMGYVVVRGPSKISMDTGLMKQAVNAGVKLKFGHSEKVNYQVVSTGPSGADVLAKGVTFRTKTKDMLVVITDDNIAPKGYTYLFISKGYGVLSTALFTHFHKVYEYYLKMRQRADEILNLNMYKVKEFGGYCNFYLERDYVRDGNIFTGESAGLQDYLLMFGLRYAITSGYIAAKSIVNNGDYSRMINNRFSKQLRISLVNRFLFEKIGNRGYKFVIRLLHGSEDPMRLMHNLYTKPCYYRLLLPLAKLSMGKRDRHRYCNCTWCRSKEQEYN